jgi:hypothetical protein
VLPGCAHRSGQGAGQHLRPYVTVDVSAGALGNGLGQRALDRRVRFEEFAPQRGCGQEPAQLRLAHLHLSGELQDRVADGLVQRLVDGAFAQGGGHSHPALGSFRDADRFCPAGEVVVVRPRRNPGCRSDVLDADVLDATLERQAQCRRAQRLTRGALLPVAQRERLAVRAHGDQRRQKIARHAKMRSPQFFRMPGDQPGQG